MEKINNYTSIEASLLGKRGHGTSKWYGAFFISVKEMFERYIVFKGFKDGSLGFFLSVMMGFYKFLTLVKIWENAKNKSVDYEKEKREILEEYN